MPLTDKDLKAIRSALRPEFERQTETLKDSIRGLNENLNAGQGAQNERLDRIEARLDAIVEMLTLRKELRNLIRELKAQGITLDERRVFVS